MQAAWPFEMIHVAMLTLFCKYSLVQQFTYQQGADMDVLRMFFATLPLSVGPFSQGQGDRRETAC